MTDDLVADEEPSGGETLPDGGAGLTVPDAEKEQKVQQFLKG